MARHVTVPPASIAIFEAQLWQVDFHIDVIVAAMGALGACMSLRLSIEVVDPEGNEAARYALLHFLAKHALEVGCRGGHTTWQ